MSKQSTYGGLLLGIEIYEIIFFILFMGYYAKRIYKLDRLASNNILENNKTMKFRITLLVILILLSIIHIVLSFADTSYWLYLYSTYSLVECLCIVDFFLQIYIITREHKKKSHSTRSLILFWGMMMVSNIATIVIVQYINPNPGIAIQFLQLAILLVLTIITATSAKRSKMPQNIDDLRESFRMNTLLPLMSQSTRHQSSKHRIYIQFNREFQVQMSGHNPQFSFKIAVYLGEQSHIIKKSEQNFINLSNQLIKMFPQNDIVYLKFHKFTSNNVLKYGEEKQKIYENYLLDLTRSCQFYVEPLMDFLQIPILKRNFLQKRTNLYKKDTLNSDDQEKLNQPFFSVTVKNKRIVISNPQILQLVINKTPQQIYEFQQRLIGQKRIKCSYISQYPSQNETVHFIQNVVNSKFLWRSFADWMCLGSVTEQKIYNMFDCWKQGFKQLEMSIIGHEISFDKEGTIIFYYLLSLKKKNSQGQAITLKKRFNQFVKLDKSIRKFVQTTHLKNAHLPNLPPKFSPFGNKTSPKARQVYFDNYIKELVSIEGINHCIKLLQFLQVENNSTGEEFYRFQQSPPNQQILQSVKVDELELENIHS